MNDQEMQFADPAWQPPQKRQQIREELDAPQPVNHYSGEQSYEQESPPQEKVSGEDDYARGYRAEQAGPQSQHYSAQQQPSSRRSPWFWIIIVLVLVTAFGGGPFFIGGGIALSHIITPVFLILLAIVLFMFFSRRSYSYTNRSTTESRTFQVGQHPRIVIKNVMGSIRVQPGGEGQEVTVQATRQMHGWLSNRADNVVDYNQDFVKNRITVKTEGGLTMIGKKSVDFVVTVPQTCDLELTSDAGSITVSNVRGQISLTSNAGNIKASEVLLQGDSRLKIDAGTITFTGAIDAIGSYQFLTDVGSINVTLPAQTAFRLEASTDVGSIHSDFAVNIQRDSVGAKARGETGVSPYPDLKLKTDVGSITLRKQK
jgi:hypothetical protein